MFKYFIPLTVNLTKNSKLEFFFHELNALWKLSGSSMGALRELVAVAGILTVQHSCGIVLVSFLVLAGINFWNSLVGSILWEMTV